MAFEIRILSGARGGQVERFDKAVVAIGRHSASDLRFDPTHDLDVSGRHAEIHTDAATGKHTIRDVGSTNGTFVNGKRIEGDVELHDGNKIQFGAKGPQTAFHLQLAPRSTEQRIAIAVSQQTAGLKRYMIGAFALIVLAAGLGYFVLQRNAALRVEELQQQLANNDRRLVTLQGGMPGDTMLVNELERRTQALRQRLESANTDAERDTIKAEIAEVEKQLTNMIRMDLPSINQGNAPAVALIVSEIGGTAFAGTGFAIAPHGLLLTNRHNVLNESGQRATRLVVKFRDSGEWLPASVVKTASELEGDLALIQIDLPGKALPVVRGVQPGAINATEGASVAIIGFPLGYYTAQEGEGEGFIAKTTLNSGTVSKRTSSILQVDSFAAHGSSGSPVLNARGYVVGVVYGGPPEGNGRIVYAVPAEKIAAFLPEEYKSIVRE